MYLCIYMHLGRVEKIKPVLCDYYMYLCMYIHVGSVKKIKPVCRWLLHVPKYVHARREDVDYYEIKSLLSRDRPRPLLYHPRGRISDRRLDRRRAVVRVHRGRRQNDVRRRLAEWRLSKRKFGFEQKRVEIVSLQVETLTCSKAESVWKTSKNQNSLQRRFRRKFNAQTHFEVGKEEQSVSVHLISYCRFPYLKVS